MCGNQKTRWIQGQGVVVFPLVQTEFEALSGITFIKREENIKYIWIFCVCIHILHIT